MAAVNLEPMTLPSAVADLGTVVLGYPAGFDQADFTGGFASATGQVAINDNDIYLEADADISLTYGASTITLTNRTDLTWPAGSRLRVQAARTEGTSSGGGGISTAAEVVAALSTAAADATLGPEYGATVAVAVPKATQAERGLLATGLAAGMVAADGLWKTNATEDALEGETLVEEVAALPDDVAEGVDVDLGHTIASSHFWRLQQAISIADSSPLNLTFPGTSLTPGTTNHTLNLLVDDVNAAVTWQIEAIATGLEGVEGRIVFENTGATARNCFPQNHATAGATVRYADDVVQADLVLPTGAGSRLTVFFEIVTDGAAGVVEITGVRTRTA